MQSTEKRSDIFLQSYAVAHPSVFSTVKCGERERECEAQQNVHKRQN